MRRLHLLLVFTCTHLIAMPPATTETAAKLPVDLIDVTYEFLQTTDESLLFQKPVDTRVTEYNFDGTVREYYPVHPGKALATYGYLKEAEMLVLIETDDTQRADLLLYDHLPAAGMPDSADTLSRARPGYLLDGNEEPISDPYFVQIFSNGPQYFIVFEHNQSVPDGIYEARFLPYEDGYAFQVLYAFSRPTRFEPIPDISRRWVIPEHGQLRVMNQQQHAVFSYRLTSNGKRNFFAPSDQPQDLNLAQWAQATRATPGESDWGTWYDEFSKVVGFYKAANRYLVGYHSPNPAYSAYSKNGSGSDDAPRWILNLSTTGGSLENPVSIARFEGGLLAGMAKEKAVVLTRENGSYFIRLLNLSDAH